ncbi:VanZ family protein [bacterium]|nr:VanZ family protein [bacterium]
MRKMTVRPGTRSCMAYDLPVIVYAATIFVLSSLPSTSLPETLFDFQDKVLHLLEFGLFALLFQRMLFRRRARTPRTVLFSILTCMAWAGLDELHQFFVPGRYCDITDFLADTAGILAAHAGWVLLRRRALS